MPFLLILFIYCFGLPQYLESRSDHSNVFRTHLVRPHEPRFVLCGLRFVSVFWRYFSILRLSSNRELLGAFVCFYVGVFFLSKQFLVFLSGLSILALFVFFPLKFFGLQNTSPGPFRTGSYEHSNCFCIAGGVLCLPTDFLLIRALVPGLLQRLRIVLHPGFLCIRFTFFRFTH